MKPEGSIPASCLEKAVWSVVVSALKYTQILPEAQRIIQGVSNSPTELEHGRNQGEQVEPLFRKKTLRQAQRRRGIYRVLSNLRRRSRKQFARPTKINALSLRTKYSEGAGVTVEKGGAAHRANLSVAEEASQRHLTQFVVEDSGIVVGFSV